MLRRVTDRPTPRPGVVRSVVLAAESFFDDLVPLVVGNLVFGASLLVAVLGAQLSILGNLLAIPLALPAAGVMRLATHQVRRGSVRLSAFLDGLRRWRLVLGLAAIQVVATLLLVLDAVIGAATGSVLGGVLMLLAIYALAALWAFAVVAWPIMLDPERDDLPVRQKLRTALLVFLARPLRALALALVVGLVLAVATVAIIVVLVFGFAFACLVAAHYTLPTADGLTGRSPDDQP
jgi:hypothetical protein